MMISTRGRYALRILVDLAENQQLGYVTLKEVAGRQEISEKYLESIVKQLVKEGILKREAAQSCEAGCPQIAYEKIADPEKAAALCEEYGCEEAFGGEFVYNRTFYAFSPENLAWLAEEGMLFAGDGFLLSAGARFNKDAALQIGFMGGDEDRAIACAKQLLLGGPWPQLVIDIPEGRADLREKLETAGFGFLNATIITLKREF